MYTNLFLSENLKSKPANPVHAKVQSLVTTRLRRRQKDLKRKKSLSSLKNLARSLPSEGEFLDQGDNVEN
jgi:hypothetical protein